jgi:predicted lipid-binding transport protein (Tim44 family)
MNSPIIQLLVLAGIAIFLILRLRSVLGTRDGFEKPRTPDEPVPDASARRRGFEVIEGGPDRDITDHVPDGSPSARAIAAIKAVEPSFSVGEFLHGARGAYEWILMAFEKGDLDEVVPFLGREVFQSFSEVIDMRVQEGLKIEANFVGLRELTLQEATFDPDTREAQLTVRFVAELTSVARNAAGVVVEGSATEIRRQRDVWTFARKIGSNDPNWQLVATSE